MVAADPTQPGRYTLGVLNSTGTQFMVDVTTDSGATWSGPTLVAENATKVHFKPWMAYSPEGILGLTWRANQPGPGPTFPYSVWAAFSSDAGTTFSTPLEISGANSPAPDPKQAAVDDVSWISLNKHNVFVAWGDWRPGEMSGFFSSVKVQAFKHPCPDTPRDDRCRDR
jgi:hypothetical protein